MITTAPERLWEAGAAAAAPPRSFFCSAQPSPVDALRFAQALPLHKEEFRVKPWG